MRTTFSGLHSLAWLFWGAVFSTACGAPVSEEEALETGSLQAPLLSDVLRIESRADGLYDVYCKDGRVERGVTKEKIIKEDVCKPPTPTRSVYDADYCIGPNMSQAQAVSRFATAATEAVLAESFNIKARWRKCTSLTGCTAWKEEVTEDTGPNWFGVSGGAILQPGKMLLELSGSGDRVYAEIDGAGITDSVWMTTPALVEKPDSSPIDLSVRYPGLKVGDGTFMTFPARLTNSCFHALLKNNRKSGPYTIETQAVLYKNF